MIDKIAVLVAATSLLPPTLVAQEAVPAATTESLITAEKRCASPAIPAKCIDAGAPITTRELDTTPLMAAVELGDVEAVRLFIEKGANVNQNSQEGTALIRALRAIHTPPTESQATPTERKEIIGLLLKCKADMNFRDAQGNTAMMEAVRTGDARLALSLLRRGPKLNRRNAQGESALIIAARIAGESRDRSIYDLLLKHPDIDTELCDTEGHNAQWHYEKASERKKKHTELHPKRID